VAHSPHINHQAAEPLCAIDSDDLTAIVAGFEPERIGLSQAWNEFYLACQAAGATHELLRAIHDIKESIEDAEGACHGH
jgi:hypothetical protein